jgi:putative transposase
VRRTNTFAVRPLTDADEALLRTLLDTSACLWNQLNYERLQNFNEGESVWDTADYRKQFVGMLGSATAQQVIRKNSEAWRSFFAARESGEDAGPPGFWGNREEGRELRAYIRNDQYTLETGDRSRLEIPVGTDLKEQYGLADNQRLRLEVCGDPKWGGEKGRLELYYDEVEATFRAIQPVTVDDPRQDAPRAETSAALDVGANTLVACTTTTGRQYRYDGRELFERFRATTEEIARLQSLLPEGQYTSRRIQRLYRRRTRRRDHAMASLARDLLERLHTESVSTIYVGNLTGVLETHWSVSVNAKTHNFWAFRAFIDRVACTAEEYGIAIEEPSEAWTSQTCPACGAIESTIRHCETLTCPCGFEGHADLTASETFLLKQEEEVTTIPRPMARPVCLTWDNHEWRPTKAAPRWRRNPNEEHTNRSTREGKLASVGAATAYPPA